MPSLQIDSVIKILCRGENDFRLLDIARVEVHRAFHMQITAAAISSSRRFVCLLDFRLADPLNKPLKTRRYAGQGYRPFQAHSSR